MSTPETDDDGNRRWYNVQRQLHREDGPAIEWNNGTRMWYLNGQRHRADGPAIEWSTGTRAWWVDGLPHREDGPAVVWNDGTREWYLHGRLLTFADWLSKAATPQHQTLMRLRWA
jgi:hypothetical protein